jgi:hypothetical protein
MRARVAGVVICAIASALTGGCATLPACPAQGGPSWRELTSDHFVLRTDLDEPQAQDTIRSFEELRAAMFAVMWPRASSPPNRTEIVALRSDAELETYVQTPLIGGMYLSGLPFGGTILFSRTRRGEKQPVVAHELAHDVSRWTFPRQPPWYAEGVARFLETIQYDRDQHQIRVGMPVERCHRAFLVGPIMPADRLLSASGVPGGMDGDRFECTAWLVVHYLINNRPAQFAELQRRLADLEPTAQAWREALPDLPPAQLDAAIDAYAHWGRYSIGSLALDIAVAPATVRVLPDADVHATRAFLFHRAASEGKPPQRDRAAAEVVEALAADSNDTAALAEALFWRPTGLTIAREDLAKRAIGAHPDDWLAWVADAAFAGEQAGGAMRSRAHADLVRALTLAPDRPEIVFLLAQSHAAEGHWSEALAFSTKALRLGTRYPELLSLHTEALARTGQCSQATWFAAALAASDNGRAGRAPDLGPCATGARPR